MANPFPGTVGGPDPNAFYWFSATDILEGEEAFREFPLTSTAWTPTNDDVVGRAFTLETIIDPLTVPEPGSMICLGLATGFGFLAKRRRRKINQSCSEE